MSKTQEKRAARISEASDFIKERRGHQYNYLKANFDVGVKIFEANKDKIPVEEQELLQHEMEKQQALLDQIKNDYGIEDPE